MIRELVDRATLEDIIGGIGRVSGLRVALYDSAGELLTSSPPTHAFSQVSSHLLRKLPQPLDFAALASHEPPARLATVSATGVRYLVAPVSAGEHNAGFVAICDLRESQDAGPPDALTAGLRSEDAARVRRSWEGLPVLQLDAEAQPVVAVRWAARLLSDWCRHELQLSAAGEGLALVGDIAELLSGEQNLDRLLDRIVSETAKAMKCTHGSLRLFDARSDELRVEAVYRLPPSYLAGGPILRRESPIDAAALGGAIVYIENAAIDDRPAPPDLGDETLVSGLAVGLHYRDEPIGVLRVYTNHRQRFRAAQRRLLKAVASQAAIAIVNARLLQQRLRAVEMERQLELAGKLQARMVRTAPPRFDSVEAAVIFEPTWHIGGDFCDFFMLPDGRFAAVVADVVGHGIHASLLMAYSRAMLRALALQYSNLGELLTRLNQQLCIETEPSEFITMLIVAVDPGATKLAFGNAGHEPPLIRRGGAILRPEDGDLVLGLDAQQDFTEHALPARHDDFVLLYTDGAVEAMNFEGMAFGRERLQEALQQHGGLEPGSTLRNLRWVLRRFVGLAEQTDDMTMVGLRLMRTGAAPAHAPGVTTAGAARP